VRGVEATLPPAFSLLKSEFNDFLFAAIGEEDNHAALTVLSALARLGVDPWQESALLAELPKDAATQRLTSVIAGLPNGSWAPSESGAIAARLVALLPAKRAFALSTRGPVPGNSTLAGPVSSSIVMLAFFAALGGLICFGIATHLRPAIGVDSPASTTTSSPSVPLAGSD
jgi:hypothetical protein